MNIKGKPFPTGVCWLSPWSFLSFCSSFSCRSVDTAVPPRATTPLEKRHIRSLKPFLYGSQSGRRAYGPGFLLWPGLFFTSFVNSMNPLVFGLEYHVLTPFLCIRLHASASSCFSPYCAPASSTPHAAPDALAAAPDPLFGDLHGAKGRRRACRSA